MTENEPPRKKKQKAGGSFCAVGGCSNRSSRDRVSAHPGRGFLRFVKLPVDEAQKALWTTRMNRDLQSWKPGSSTKVCTDHFFLHDFREDDLQRLSDLKDSGRRIYVRLKPNSAPNTERSTGNFADPFAENSARRSPEDRLPELQADWLYSDHDVESQQELVVGCDADQKYSNTNEIHRSSTDNSYKQLSDADLNSPRYALQSDLNHPFVTESGSQCNLYSTVDRHEAAAHETDKVLSSSSDLTILQTRLLLMLFKFCPECGTSSRVTSVSKLGFDIVIGYRCYGILPHEGIWKSTPLLEERYVKMLGALISGAAYV